MRPVSRPPLRPVAVTGGPCAGNRWGPTAAPHQRASDLDTQLRRNAPDLPRQARASQVGWQDRAHGLTLKPRNSQRLRAGRFRSAAQLRQFPSEGWRKVAELRADGVFEAHPTAIDDLFQCCRNRFAAPSGVGRSSAPTSLPNSAARRRQPSRPTARQPQQRLAPRSSQPWAAWLTTTDALPAQQPPTPTHGNATKPTSNDAHAAHLPGSLIEGAIAPTRT